MTSREKVEAWYLENWGHTEDDHETLFERDPDSDEEYYRLGVRLAHEAWQAAELASEQKLTDMAVQLANAESKCRELAAENVAVKECASDVMRHVYRSKTYLDSNRVVDAIQGIQCAIERKAGKTPATDTFLAEVRAQGVEMFADFCGEENSVFVEAKAYYRSLSDAVDEFAAQLRQGAKS